MKLLSRILAPVVAAAGVLAISAADTQPGLAWHYLGNDAVMESNPDSVWRAVSQIKPANAFENQIKTRLVRWLPGRLGWDNAGWTAGDTFLRPLLNDVFDSESLLHMEGDDLADARWAFAIRLNEERMSAWTRALLGMGRQRNLKEPTALNVDGVQGWSLESAAGETVFGYVTQGSWLIIGDNLGGSATAREWTRRLVRDGRPVAEEGDPWLTLAVSPGFFGWDLQLPVLGGVKAIHSQYSWQDTSVRTTMELELMEEYAADLEAWRTPRDLVIDPIVSFTAVRGAGDWLATFDAIQGLPVDLRPSQLFNWTRGDISLMSEFAFPVADADKAFSLLKKSVPASYGKSITEYSLGKWVDATNNVSRMLWRGLPVFVPYIDPVNPEAGQDYIKAGVFPLVPPPDAKPAPDALYEQFENRDGLFYYDWEITAARIAAYQQAERFLNLVFTQRPSMANAYGVEWLANIFAQLENTITEASRTDSRTIRMVRKSGLGFTGMELWLLTHWLDTQDFPSFPYASPARRASLPGALPNGERPMPRPERVTR